MTEPKWGWWAGPNEEFFSYGGPFETREEAIECGRENDDGDGFYIVEALEQRIRFKADWLIEAQYAEQDDYFDYEHGEPDRVGPKAAIEAADAELQALLDTWLDKHRSTFVAPNLFAASRNQEWIEGSCAEAALASLHTTLAAEGAPPDWANPECDLIDPAPPTQEEAP